MLLIPETILYSLVEIASVIAQMVLFIIVAVLVIAFVVVFVVGVPFVVDLRNLPLNFGQNPVIHR